MRLLLFGDRDWTDRAAVRRVIELVHPSVVIEGEAPGADTLAREEAEDLGVPVDPYPADWTRYGKPAGPIRNKQMLDEGQPDLGVYFHDDLSRSKGTKDMIRQAEKAGVPVFSYKEVR